MLELDCAATFSTQDYRNAVYRKERISQCSEIISEPAGHAISTTENIRCANVVPGANSVNTERCLNDNESDNDDDDSDGSGSDNGNSGIYESD
ncbi:hypothetical protein KIN20_007588 [Parelaphostrongylus tenuis]|uniref:Uncharacterized protein n=1 Tax=Parelaphostrongylus tenuis TaxID=148309 RepID=A0AAD5QM51_PARTN|nr:hypothetical protein KIN20_007588 [Parelaphostrongylus tenuis]